MAWNTNIPPLEYLQQRVRYYEKGLRKTIKMSETDSWKEKFTQEQFDRAINNTKIRLEQYKQACYILAENL